MGIYLLSLSHKTTPLEVRGLFSYGDSQKEQILSELSETGCLDEIVVLSTCNRMELYCNGADEADGKRILELMEQAAVRAAGAEQVPDMGAYIRRYQGFKAVHHLFMVTAGLDSMVIGEDQILGQVKQAYDFSRERGYTKTVFNTLFRDVVTGAKKVKTDTLLSKTSVSTASLAMKAAQETLGGLEGKNLLIIGATGTIGNIVLKNVQSIRGLNIYVTMRSHASIQKLGHGLVCEPVPFEERYRWMDRMDVIVSATASPHYTLTKSCLKEHVKTEKPRVFLDLAVPPDLEESIRELPGAVLFNMENMEELARRNNEKKQAELETADRILKEYEDQFYKWMLFRQYQAEMDVLKETVVREACEKGVEAAVSHLFYRLREAGTAQELSGTMEAFKKANEAEAEKERPPVRQRRGKAEQDAYFPLFFNLKGKPVLLVGAGKIASRRAEILAEFGAHVTVVAPEGAELMERLAAGSAVTWHRRSYRETDLDGQYLVIAATSDKELNTQIVLRGKAEQMLVNNAGDKSQCDFYFPGIAREGRIVAGVTTSGKDHGLASEITAQMQSWLKQFSS